MELTNNGRGAKKLRLAAIADLHCTRTSQGAFAPLFTAVNDEADILLLCGDLTDHGMPEEAQVLLKELTGVRIPMIAVLGNHDLHTGKQEELEKIFADVGMHVLDGDDCEVSGLGFAGVKGFCGGFGRHTLEAWGEEAVKRFVYESVEESLKLEKALARLQTPQRIAVLHYAPIQTTVEGEPEPIYAFLGSSRLEEPLERYQVAAAFHGHAHHGKPEGKTKAGIPVYNVSLPVRRPSPGTLPPLPVFEFEVTSEAVPAR